jgi:Predicted membrane protein (DUF2339)
MEILFAVAVVILVILFIPALVIRQGLRSDLERLERLFHAQAAELSELRSRLQTGPGQAVAPPPVIPAAGFASPASPSVNPPPEGPIIWPSQLQTAPRLPVQPEPSLLTPGPPPERLAGRPQSAVPPQAGRAAPAQPAAPPPAAARPGWSPTPRFLFAATGALLTLGGLAAVLTQLARAGVFTPELQLLLAALLGVGLYALAPRASGAVRGALQGLGYGILALCMGALHQVGVLPAGAVLGLVLILSGLVGLHARRQGQLLGIAVALTGATVSTWLLADDLEFSGLLLWAQVALLAVGAAAAGAALNSRAAPARLLVLTLPIGVAGLLVVAADHGTQGAPLLWAALALLMAGVVVRLSGSGPAGSQPANDDKPIWPLLPVLPLGLLVTTLLCAGPLAWAAQQGAARQGDLAASLSLLGLCAGLLALAAWRIRGRGLRTPDLIREALVASATAAAGAWLGAALQVGEGAQRLIPLALALALYGRWSGSAAWRWGSALVASLLLLSGLPELRAGHALLAVSALGSALAIGGRSGSLVAACAALVLTVWGTALPINLWIFTLAGLGAVLAALFVLPRLRPVRALPLLIAAFASLGTLLAELLSLAYPALNVDISASLAAVLTSVVLGVALRLPGTAPLLGRLRPAGLLPAGLEKGGFELRVQQFAEGLALLCAVVALNWLLITQAQTSILFAAVALLVPFLRGVIPWPLVSLPLMGLSLLVSLSIGEAELIHGGPTTALLSLVAASLALWLTGSHGGRRRLPLPAQARRDGAPLEKWALSLGERGAACWGAVIAALAAQFAARLASLAGTEGLLGAGALPVTLSLLSGGIVMLVQGRERRSVPVWWTGLGLFALASAKLVVADLDTLGTGGRGAALALIGLTLLGIAQLAPQARPEREEPESGSV